MKTNISGLMSLISEYEKKLLTIENLLGANVYSMSIQELNGTINIIEDTKEEFNLNLDEYNKLLNKVTYLKSVLYEKNNTFTLSDNRTIQTAIIDNSNLRKQKALYESFLYNKNSKRRVTEVNNSYFECKTINFDLNKIKEDLVIISNKLQKTDFEISKLNSIEFDIND